MSSAGVRHTAMQWHPETTPGERAEGTDQFFDLGLWVLVTLPIVVVIVAAAIKRKRTPALPHVGDADWEERVAANPLPVVVHVYSTWSIGDRVIENQVQQLARSSADRLEVAWLDVDKNPGVRSRHPTLMKRSVALFRDGRLLWQAVGVHDHVELLREIDEVLDACPPGLPR